MDVGLIDLSRREFGGASPGSGPVVPASTAVSKPSFPNRNLGKFGGLHAGPLSNFVIGPRSNCCSNSYRFPSLESLDSFDFHQKNRHRCSNTVSLLFIIPDSQQQLRSGIVPSIQPFIYFRIPHSLRCHHVWRERIGDSSRFSARKDRPDPTDSSTEVYA